MLRELGGADVGFIGVNGIDESQGFTTHTNLEVRNKVDIISMSKKSYLLGDTSKVGVVEQEKFADFFDDIGLIVDTSEKTKILFDSVKEMNARVFLA